jgi:hypothetical protein
MPRQGRLDFPEAIHCVCVSGRPRASIFFDESIIRRNADSHREHSSDVRQFEFLLARACDESGALVHGYSWLPNSAIIVIQRFDVPLELTMGSVFGQYSRYLRSQGRAARDQAVYSSRYASKVIAPMYLPYAVRRAHRRPVDADLCTRAADYPFSSERVYAGKLHCQWVTTSAVLGALQQRGYGGPTGYHQFMEKGDSEHVARLFTRGSRWDRRAVSDHAFVGEAMWKAANVRPAPSRDQVINAVARLMRRPSAVVYERTPDGVLGRALVAWYATRSGAATLLEVGRWFSRSASTLRREIDKYRVLKAALFGLTSLELLSSRVLAECAESYEFRGKSGVSVDGVE